MGTLTLVAGPDSFTGSKDPKTGIVAIRLKLFAETVGDALNGELPDFGLGSLVEYQPRTFSRMPAGEVGFEVVATVEGHQTPDSADGVEYFLEGATRDELIDLHPNLQVLIDVYGGRFNVDLHRTTWDPLMPENKGGSNRGPIPGFETFTHSALDPGRGSGSSRRNPMHGVETWLCPTLVWGRRFFSQSIPPGVVSNLGKIVQPPGNPPELSGNRVWIQQAARARFRGNGWEIEERWLLTGPYGVAPEMYDYPDEVFSQIE